MTTAIPLCPLRLCVKNSTPSDRLRYAQTQDQSTNRLTPEGVTSIGVTCRLRHRLDCTARSAPPIGRQILPDDNRRTTAPFGFSDS